MKSLSLTILFSLFFIFSCGGGLTSPKQDEDSTTNDDTDTVESVCGDEIVTGDEVCDGNLGLCTEIDPKLYKAGKAFCKDDCSGWKTATCEEIPHECGNSIVEGPELCDTITQLCTEFDATKYKSGTVTCASDCLEWDFSNCEELNAECGDKIVEGDEICDGNTINCRDIDDDRFIGGIALCKKDCTDWDTLTCEEKSDYDPPLDEDTSIIDEDVQSDEDIVCVTNCETVGAKRCALGTQVESCQLFEGGCKMWQPLTDCNDSGRFCHDYLVLGDDTTNNIRDHVLKGNYVHATESMAVRSFDMMLDIGTEQRLTWVVYESDTVDGVYTLIFQNDVEYPGTGKKFYNSGLLFKDAMPFSVESGKYYLFGVAWENDMISYYHDYNYSTQEEETLFGPAEGGTATTDSWPVQSTMAGPAGTSLYFMRFDTDNTATDICECVNDCDTPGEEQCNGDTIQECIADATYGCRAWENQDDCTSHFPAQICSASGGVASCENDCVDTCDNSGDKQCNGFVIQQCNTGSKGCLEWQYDFDCAAANKWCSESGTDANCVDTPPANQTEYIGHLDTQTNNSTTDSLKLNFIHATADATLTGLQLKLAATTSSGSIEELRVYESTTFSGTYNIIATQSVSVTSTTAQYIGYTNFNVAITNGRFYALGIRIGTTSDVSYYYNARSGGLPAYDTDFSTTDGAWSTSTDYPTTFTNPTTGESIYNMKLTYTLKQQLKIQRYLLYCA